MHYLDGHVAEDLFSEHHFKTLMHVDRVCTELNGGFEVGLDAFMRNNKGSFNVLSKRFNKPLRPADFPRYPKGKVPRIDTVLRDGSVVTEHDDWSCVHDMGQVGYFYTIRGGQRTKGTANEIMPGTTIYISPRGRAVVEALKTHLVENRDCTSFQPPSAG